MKYAVETGGGSREQIASRITDWGSRVLRYGLALVIAWIGLMKFTGYEANGIQTLVANSPLLGWTYHFLTVRQLSGALGVIEVGTAILIALRPWSAKASAIGSAMAVLMFPTTLSFLFSTPGWEPSLGGFPALSGGVGQFLLKDVVLLGAAIRSLGESLKHTRRTLASEGGHRMNRIAFSPVAIVLLAGVVASIASVSGRADGEGAPVFVTKIPPGYRDWRFISVAREEGDLDDIRAILGNDVAIKTYREGKLPFPDGTIIARLAWSYDASEENNKVFGRPQSFVAGHPKNGVQFMVKDSKKYASTGGWGFGQFDDGKPADVAVLNTCFACHAAVKERDLVFTRYAP